MDLGSHGACVDVFVDRVDCGGVFDTESLGIGCWGDDGVGDFYAHCVVVAIPCSEGVICVGCFVFF